MGICCVAKEVSKKRLPPAREIMYNISYNNSTPQVIKDKMESGFDLSGAANKSDLNFVINSAPNQHQIEPEGQDFQNAYKLENPITASGCKVVRAIEMATGLMRAVKVITRDDTKQDLLTELDVIRTLDHPHIQKTLGIFTDKSAYYIVTEFYSGGDLFSKLAGDKLFTEAKAATYIKDILTALAYCHLNGIIHGAIEPQRILFDSPSADSSLRIGDFRTAIKFDSVKALSSRLESAYYIAPEMLEEEYDSKCDIWSAGVILYTMLCGYPPFTGRSDSEIMSKIKTEQVAFDVTGWTSISQEAKSLLQRMLTKDPKQRPSASEACEDPWIKSFESGTEISEISVDTSKLKDFWTKGRFQHFMASFIATETLLADDKTELMRVFKALDINHDGMLTNSEIIQGFRRIQSSSHLSDAEIVKLCEDIDSDSSGSVDYTDFIAALTNYEQNTSKETLERAFRVFKADEDGRFPRKELDQMTGEALLQDPDWQRTVQEVDKAGDGKISLAELTELLIEKKFEDDEKSSAVTNEA